MSICLVSAYLDIGRQKWQVFQRSLDQYFNNFLPYTKIKHEMIVFMDENHIERLRILCKDATHIKILPLNIQFMENHIYAYRQLDREREIMKSETFQRLIQHRIHHPECCKPEYNIMQHAKIDFVNYVINHKLSNAEYYAWTDFGYFQLHNRIPKYPLDLNKFDLSRVNFQGMNDITEIDNNTIYTLQNAPEKVGGFFYLANKSLMAQYQQVYHEISHEFHKMGIVDDDQHIMIKCVFRKPELFKVWNLRGWHLVYNFFQQTPHNSNFS